MGNLRKWIFKLTAYRIAVLLGLGFAFSHCVGNGHADSLPVIGRLELIFHDLKFHERGPRKPSGDVVIAAVDERAIGTIGHWDKWSRADQAHLLQKLTDLGARAIVMDVSWTDESFEGSGAVARKLSSRFGEVSLANASSEALLAKLESARTDADGALSAAKALKDGSTASRDVQARLDPIAQVLRATHAELAELREKQKSFEESLAREVSGSDPDSALAQTLATSGRIVLGSFLLRANEIDQIPKEQRDAELARLKHLEIARPLQSERVGEGGSLAREVHYQSFAGARAPLAKFMIPTEGAEPQPVAFYNTDPDHDGVIRRTGLVLLVEPEGADPLIFPNLDLGGVVKYFGARASDVVPLASAPDVLEYVAVPNRTGKPADWVPGPDDYRYIPVDGRGQLLLNYYGPKDIMPQVSLGDVWTGAAKRSDIEGKLVIFGVTATGTYDQRVTPFDKFAPGITIHATSMENILHDDYLKRPWWAWPLEVLVLLGLAFIVGAVLARVPVFTGFFVMLAVGIGYHLFDYAMFRSGIAIFSALPLTEVLAIYVGQTIYRYTTEEREKQQIRRAFQFYLTKSVMEEMLKDPSKLKLGGEKRVLSVMFSDIRGFTTISERLPPEALAKLINEYLTPMTNLVFETGGTLDKYIGDAVMAIWGAPIAQEDHAYRACKTAVAMMAELGRLQERWRLEGNDYPPIDIGIGINSGPMVVGNMGADQRFDYTVLGDNVNLASRLEGTNKDYKSHIIISEKTYDMCKELVAARELGAVRVKGKKEPMRILELMDDKPATGDLAEIIRRFNEGITHFKAQNWAACKASMRSVMEFWPHDGPSHAYIEFAEEYEANPPGEGWDGVYTMTHK